MFMLKNHSDRFRPNLLRWSLLPLVSAVMLYGTSCSPKTTGAVKDDVSMTQQTAKLEEAGVNYNGPQYNVAIMTFETKNPGKVLGIGEAATDILRTIVKKSGLEPVSLTEGEMKEKER